MDDTNLLVVDTETGGLDPARDSLLSVSFVKWSPGGEGPTLDLFIREPEIIATAESLAINRIDPDRLREEGLEPAAAVDRIDAFVARCFPPGQRVVLAGHNVGFDIGFLKRLYRLAGKDYTATFSHRSFDTATTLRFLRIAEVLDLADDRSETAFRHFGVEPSSAARHSASGDALATARLITRLVALVKQLASNAGYRELRVRVVSEPESR